MMKVQSGRTPLLKAAIAAVVIMLVLAGLLQLRGLGFAATNPTLTVNCESGLDVALLVDTSGSTIGAPREQERSAMKTFVTSLRSLPMMYMIGNINLSGETSKPVRSFTANADQALADIDVEINGSGASELGNLQDVTRRDPRPDKPNLIVVLTDGKIRLNSGGNSHIDSTKQEGTRILAIGVGKINEENGQLDVNLPILKEIGGPSVNTGSVWTSDVITTDYDHIGAQLRAVALELCPTADDQPVVTQPEDNPNVDPVTTPDETEDSGGQGGGPRGLGLCFFGFGCPNTGSQQGEDEGEGENTSNNPTPKSSDSKSELVTPDKPADVEKPKPSASPQGLHEPDPEQKPEPTPFWDGRLFGAGSSADLPNTYGISIAGWKLGYGWLYLTGGLALVGAGVWVGWRAFGTGLKSRLKLRLRK